MEGLLDGLTVVEMSRRFAASYATKLMADLGATVIKVEEPAGDPVRGLPPFAGGVPHREKSGAFLYLNCNKQGVTLGTTTSEGRKVLDRLLETTDILVHDFQPAAALAAGLDWDRVRSINPELIMTTVTPFGLAGPYAEYNAYDLTVASAGGWTTVNGQPGHPEMPPLRAFGHQAAFQAGVNAAVATMGAAVWRLKSGKGQHVEVSAQECITSILELTYVTWPYMGVEVVRYGQRPLHPIDFFECKDGWIFVLCLEEKQWRSFVEMMDNPDWAEWDVFANAFTRASNWDVLKPFIAEWVAEWTVDDLYRAAQAKRIPFAPVSTMADLLDSPHLKARGFFVEIAHPEAGAARYPGAPYKIGGNPWEIRSPAPTLGQHNEEILCGRLGMTAGETEALRTAGVIT
jgi:crotonobetainyl-CoA:carnitine CoA-transferase CaiB-like acyl-CoA transferase